SRKDGGTTREEEGREYDSDSAASDTSRATTTTPLTKEDLRQLLCEIKANMTTEFDRHLTPIKEDLIDLTHRATGPDSYAHNSERKCHNLPTRSAPPTGG
ncbi:Hypothetical predicted protein, partial [Pelobates cultripes]